METNFPIKREVQNNKAVIQETTSINNNQQEKLDTIEHKLDLVLKSLKKLGGIGSENKE